jgi:YgiT-type zinc finger domain-containing protein
MKPFDKCPVCGGELAEKHVEKILRGGNHTAILTVSAEVCLHCGERLYVPEVIKRFEEIRSKLEREEISDFQPVGRAFLVTP